MDEKDYQSGGTQDSKNTRATPVIKKPYGVMEIQRGWDNAAPMGCVFQTNPAQGFPGWHDIEATEGTYDWTKIADQLKLRPRGKFMGLTIGMLPSPPAWLASKGVKIYSVQHGGVAGRMVPWFNPWDAIAQPYLLRFIQALCQRIDGQVDYLVMDGVGVVTESYIADLNVIGETADQALMNWSGSTNRIIDQYGSYLRSTPFIMAIAPPIPGYKPSLDSLGTIIRSKLDQWPLFGVSNYGLNGSTNYQGGFLPNVLIHEGSTAGHFCGFQFSTQYALHGTFADALNAALGCGARYVEAWGGDAENQANAAAIADFNAKCQTA